MTHWLCLLKGHKYAHYHHAYFDYLGIPSCQRVATKPCNEGINCNAKDPRDGYFLTHAPLCVRCGIYHSGAQFWFPEPIELAKMVEEGRLL